MCKKIPAIGRGSQPDRWCRKMVFTNELKITSWPGRQILRLTSHDLHTAFSMDLAIFIKSLKDGKRSLTIRCFFAVIFQAVATTGEMLICYLAGDTRLTAVPNLLKMVMNCCSFLPK